ncbi:hypothetical protein PILCRDRAFT_818210 [Piloderma croceum F 1598]|uniref:Ammonium transporter n=1 Tax=Piloderma croceum (strain F 1598) TaxID=765440 RepID=A0A0C3G235_PILCF|nr:hypothetical protein PILCRDRAFT_818210 [Piloderma croceum F 1598]
MHTALEAIVNRVAQGFGASNAGLLRRDSSQFDKGDVAFIIIAAAMSFFMVPGLAFLYAGLARRKSAMSLIWVVSCSNAVVIAQWLLFGYSLAFSSTANNGFVGDLGNMGLRNVLGDPSPGSTFLPELLYSFYQMEFACVTVGILVGAIAERGRVLPMMAVTLFWTTLVYCPLAYWAWGKNGWAFKWGVLDFAGGGPVEIGSGVGGLVYAWVLGRRREKELINFRPYNVSMVVLGTFMLWFGWIGFNGGCAFGANLRAIMAIWNTMIAAAFGGMAWCLFDYRIGHKFSMVSFCSGTIAGLVLATSASGYVSPWAAMIMGVVAGILCNVATKLKFYLGVDDALDLTALHGVGGVIGLLFNGFFATKSVISLDGVNTSVIGGLVDSNWRQLYIQGAYVAATTGYTFVVTALIVKGIDMIPGLQLRASEESETLGTDDMEIGEFANDFIEVRRHFNDYTQPAEKSSAKRLSHKPSESITVHVTASERKRPNAELYIPHSQIKLHDGFTTSQPPCCDVLHNAITLAKNGHQSCTSGSDSVEESYEQDMLPVNEKAKFDVEEERR